MFSLVPHKGILYAPGDAMTPDERRRIVTALDTIACLQPCVVPSARPGIVVATPVLNGQTVAFRRKGGRVRVEFWGDSGFTLGPELPADLEAEAARLIDRPITAAVPNLCQERHEARRQGQDPQPRT